MFSHFWLRRGHMVLRPHLYCLPSRFTLVRSLYWVLGFCGVRPGYCCVGDDRCADSFASLAQCGSCGVFFPSFAIFAPVWGLLFFLRNFSFFPSLHFWCCPFLLRLSFLLFSLSPPVAGLVCFSCWPPSMVVRVYLWGPVWCTFMFEPQVSPCSHVLISKDNYQICV